ncbi:ATP-binding region ATPase domain protein [Planctopirus limnophila DSM 3776]|uniref:ATP-binding region ATPase domain protein n=1 Tax=Planctopirus limnophila (strain ATCC 43296 / DSM 3776 / IFAM 1008 / Mu 290) TaxID=521674 RepID=D5SXP2_PLAL2|nr:HSP90 family protein [Planctopirus limnophila]ADG67609.1 ATP-binding region ATPase domain protein [Planctopirus limnophila DSM 3776]
MSSPANSRFQVDLRGMIELLSEHLYSSPSVFVRELLQNSVDAISARRLIDSTHTGSIEIELTGEGTNSPTIVITDTGIGLNLEEIEQFLATIGGSSKRATVDRPADFLGQFGIGLLACFLVTDEIVVITRSAKPASDQNQSTTGLEWRGKADGTYTVRQLSTEIMPGTQVFLKPKASAISFYRRDKLEGLLRNFGDFLYPPIHFLCGTTFQLINRDFPWNSSGEFHSRTDLLAFGKTLFDVEFIDAIPIRSESGKASGVAYLLPNEVSAGVRQQHRVYLKGMLVSDKIDNILPEWAFFARCVINAEELRPTASREMFYTNDIYDQTRNELGESIRQYLIRMKRLDPLRLQELVHIHSLAIRSLCTHDDECLNLFADLLPFETTLGVMTLGDFIKENQLVRYVPSIDQFRQLAPVTTAEGIHLLNAGHIYDEQILLRCAQLRSDIQIEAFDSGQLADRLESLTFKEREDSFELAKIADLVLREYQCESEIVKFHPMELPSLYIQGTNSELLRLVDQGSESQDPLFSSILGNFARSVESGYARLQLNYRNPLIQRIAKLSNRQGQTYCIEMLFVQALLMARVPLRQKETRLLNRSLLGMIEWSLDERKGDECESF